MADGCERQRRAIQRASKEYRLLLSTALLLVLGSKHGFHRGVDRRREGVGGDMVNLIILSMIHESILFRFNSFFKFLGQPALKGPKWVACRVVGRHQKLGKKLWSHCLQCNLCLLGRATHPHPHTNTHTHTSERERDGATNVGMGKKFQEVPSFVRAPPRDKRLESSLLFRLHSTTPFSFLCLVCKSVTDPSSGVVPFTVSKWVQLGNY